MEQEIRSFDIDYRYASDNRTIEGYSVVFNSYSHDLGGFKEIINPRALEGVLERSDIALLLNHDNSRGILARSKNGSGSLELEVDDLGLRFSTEAPHTSLGDEVLEYLRRGDATQCSFAFTVADGGDAWTKDAEGRYIRTINQIDRLFDCSILTCTPAYEATSVACRSFEDFKAEEQRLLDEQIAKERAEEERKLAEEAEKKAAEIANYYTQLKEEYKDYLK